jgi:predicted lipoprotein with Yx(FWY)xxD motif
MTSALRAPKFVVLLSGLAVAAAACTGGGATPSAASTTASPSVAPTDAPTPSEEPSPSATETASPSADAEVELEVESSGLGEIVVDGEGRTLYLFTRDTQGAGASVCNGDCATAWPPLTVEDADAVVADDDVTAEVGTATRDDGSLQVTLNGWPLYYFQADAAPGDTNGQGVNDVWWVVDPAGEAITD